MEYGALRISIMVFCQNNLFLGISAAYGRTIAVTAWNNLSGTDALNPGDFVGMLLIRSTAVSLLRKGRRRLTASHSPYW